MASLRPYQQEAVEILVQKRRHMECDAMGLGKTVTTLAATEQLGQYPVLVIGTKNSLGVWRRELETWFQKESLIYTGDTPPAQRAALWEKFKREKLPYLIISYGMLKEIMSKQVYWKAAIADEVHRVGILNRKTATWKRFKKLQSDIFIPVTGTPMRQSPADLWGPFHLLRPAMFPSYWGYVNKHCVVTTSNFGKEIERRPKNPSEFRQFVRQFMIRRTEKEVLSDLPERSRSLIPITMTAKQEKYYVQMTTSKVIVDGKHLVVAQNALVRDLHLRELLISPRMLDLDEKGAILEALPEYIENEFLEGNSVVLFTPFRQAVSLLVQELEAMGKSAPDHIGVIHGGLSYDQVDKTARRFQSLDTTRKVMVCTIKSATSFDLHAASACYFIGYDWDPNNNDQAEKRLHRIGQKKFVRSYYFQHEGTIDDYVLEVLGSKQSAVNIALRPEHLLPTCHK